ncbi:hypothetical protein HCN58_17990 [Bradyrhizobium sp. WSM 1791]|uniref:Uncharacterized protein n=1 Tax=Bradyrhizobium australiense TaxID=2721161 RepID=A0A7Y4GT97_9BRAD|nr:hypothetical protein [Bradyrhizobium australiense]NOJ41471.1 hypothetical protein [Bradyrhizobium australiense]
MLAFWSHPISSFLPSQGATASSREGVSQAGRNVRPTVGLVAPRFKALVGRTNVDHHRLNAAADLLYAITCRHLELNSLSLEVDYLGRSAHVVAYRRGGAVLYVYCSADRALDEARENQIFVRSALAV